MTKPVATEADMPSGACQIHGAYRGIDHCPYCEYVPEPAEPAPAPEEQKCPTCGSLTRGFCMNCEEGEPAPEPSSKEKVLKVYPDAYAHKWGGWRDGESGFVIIRDRAEYEERLGAAETEIEAWQDAASKLAAPALPESAPAATAERELPPLDVTPEDAADALMREKLPQWLERRHLAALERQLTQALSDLTGVKQNLEAAILAANCGGWPIRFEGVHVDCKGFDGRPHKLFGAGLGLGDGTYLCETCQLRIAESDLARAQKQIAQLEQEMQVYLEAGSRVRDGFQEWKDRAESAEQQIAAQEQELRRFWGRWKSVCAALGRPLSSARGPEHFVGLLKQRAESAEQQFAALQGRIEEADGFLRDQLAWCPCDEIHSDPPCDRCKRVAKWLTAPIAPEKDSDEAELTGDYDFL